ncbi:hypothetical protein [Mesorhizobium sp. M7A.F.Ca.US.008.03.1.1]|uniref:hypothetical protein n=1 Tax=Mesorhizobium sp. M7A.F.Ca.US.008.03.1.1 TaxID=2496742 RepID=UPI000FCB7A54|nr:hypothetical protein [Mesorhizobium sp. M7A.F.Ca.US.008.03.1.1]RUW61857.1 hypothetical protein EOA16_10505 [Mesorhizobium sp. M7A.F.Ca.US.008.03.1.1]
MLWRASLVLGLGLSYAPAWAQEATLKDIAPSQDNFVLEVRSLPIHPWFGSGSGRDWDAPLSATFDQIFVKDGSSVAALEGVRVADLLLAFLDDQIAQPAPAENLPADVKAALGREAEVKAEIAALEDKIAVASGSERVKLRRELEKLEQELVSLSFVTSAVSPDDGSFYKDLRAKAKNYVLSDGGLRLDIKPLVGAYAVVNDWKTVVLQGTDCPALAPAGAQDAAKNLASLSTFAEVTRLAITRKWASTVFGTRKEFTFNSPSAEHANLAGLAEKTAYRIDALYLARRIELRGAISLDDINLLAAESPEPVLLVGCTQVSFTKGLGFKGLSTFPVSLASGLAVNFPQIVGIELSPLPAVKFSD